MPSVAGRSGGSSTSSSPHHTSAIRRSSVSSSCSPSFLVSGKTFTKQFAALYFIRLHALRSACHAAAGRAGLAALVCSRLLDVRAGVQCVLTGTVYKEQKLKPSILSEYAAQKKGQLPPTQHATNTQLQQHQAEAEEAEADRDGALARLAASRGPVG